MILEGKDRKGDIRGLDSGQGFEGGRTGDIKRTGR